MGQAEPNIWGDLRRLWIATSAAHSRLKIEEESDEEEEGHLRALTVSVARLTRNLVAAVPYNQEKALSALVFDILANTPAE